MNVLCIGSRLDRTFAHTIARFALLDVPLVVVDLYDLLASGAISFNLERRTTTIEVANLSIDFADYSGVYSRAFDVSDGAPTDALRDRTRNAFHTLAFALRNDVAPRIVGRSGELSNLSKVFHLSLVRDLLAGFGILVPRSIVTNAGDELRAFIGDRSRFIVKGASAFKSSADEFGNEHLSRLQEHLPVPALVQQLISGPDVRSVLSPIHGPLAVFGRTHPCAPIFKSRLRTIHRLDSANSVIRLAVFLASPRYLTLT
jgi:hypothetical protein